MKQIITLFCEGSEAKIAYFEKVKDSVKIVRVAAVPLSKALNSAADMDKAPVFEGDELSSEISLDKDTESNISIYDSSDVGMIGNALRGINIKKVEFIPIVTEPILNFHPYEGQTDSRHDKTIENIKKDIQAVKGISVASNMIDFVELKNKSLMGVFLEGDIPCIHLVNLLASHYRRRYLKIAGIKAAELSLAYYVSKSTKFFPEDFSLIIYIGKEYNKLLFLEG